MSGLSIPKLVKCDETKFIEVMKEFKVVVTHDSKVLSANHADLLPKRKLSIS
jgi:hypothetical protein